MYLDTDADRGGQTFRLHDDLVRALRRAHEADLFRITIDVQDLAEAPSPEKEHGEAVAVWLERNRPDDWAEVMRRASCAAIIEDALHFIYEALRCSEKGKLAVTYALIRKPFRESLLLLELLLADADEYVTVFRKIEAKERSLNHLVQQERGRALIRRVVPHLLHRYVFDPEFLYEVRYDKRVHYSLEGLWNKAMHLVTEHPSYATEPQNLNFVFSDGESMLEQWERLYRLVPFLLFYFAEVVLALLRRMGGGRKIETYAEEHQRTFGFILWGRDVATWRRDEDPAIAGAVHASGASEDQAGFVSATRRSLDAFANVGCPGCGTPFLAADASLSEIYTTSRVTCPGCRLTIIFGDEGMRPGAILWRRLAARSIAQIACAASRRDPVLPNARRRRRCLKRYTTE